MSRLIFIPFEFSLQFFAFNSNCLYMFSAERLKELTTWLKEIPAAKAERQTCGAQVLEEELVKAIEETVDTFNSTKQNLNIITMQVKPHLLYLVSVIIIQFPQNTKSISNFLIHLKYN